MMKYAYRKSDKVKTNVDALVGSKGRVTEIIDFKKNTGRVFVNGDDWKAESENGEIIQQDEQIKVNYTKPRPSNIPKQYDYIQFYGITLDSLQQLMTNNLCTGLIQSNYNIEYIEKAVKYNTNFVQIKNKYNFLINAMADTTISKHTQLLELEAAQQEEHRTYIRKLQEYNRQINRIEEIQTILSDKILSNYERNKLQNELIDLRRKKVEKPTFEPSLQTQVKISELRKSLTERNLQFSVYLTVYKIVDPSLPETRKQYREIEDNYVAEAKEQSIFK